MALSRTAFALDRTRRTSGLKRRGLRGIRCWPSLMAPRSWRSRKARTIRQPPPSSLRGRRQRAMSRYPHINSGCGRHNRAVLHSVRLAEGAADGVAAALSDARVSRAPETGWLAGIQQSIAAGMQAIAPGRCGRPALVGEELSRRLHLLQFGEPHAPGVTDICRIGAAAAPACALVCRLAAIRPGTA